MPGNPLSITLPTVGSTIGPLYATQVNAAIQALIDDVEAKITPDEITINADLSFTSAATAYGAIDLERIEFTSQGDVLAPGNINSLYSNGGELYFQDGSGNDVIITAAGSVTGAAGNITTTGSPAYATGGVELLWDGGDLQYQFKTAAGNNFAGLVFGSAEFRNGANTMSMSSGVTSDYELIWPTDGPSAAGMFAQFDATGAITFSAAPTVEGALTVEGLVTAEGGITLSADQNVTVSGTGTYKHATRYKQVAMTGGYPTSANISIQASDGSSPYVFWRIIDSVTNVNFLVFPLDVEEGQILESVEFKHTKLIASAESVTVEVFRVSVGRTTGGTRVFTGATSAGSGDVTTSFDLSSHAVVADNQYYLSLNPTIGGTSQLDIGVIQLGFSE